MTALAFSTQPCGQGVAVHAKGKPLLTPARKPLEVPTQALAEAIIGEWQVHKKFSASTMPITALAYTAIDRIAGQEEAIIEALLVYIDTDTLSYRSTQQDTLAERQKSEWDPLTAWASKEFSAIWQTTSGIMPLQQPAAVHQAIRELLAGLSPMQLSAACVLSSCFSSILLAIAVVSGKIGAQEAFRVSRLEEIVQAEQWGKDFEAEQRTSRIQAEIMAAERFLRLLEPR